MVWLNLFLLLSSLLMGLNGVKAAGLNNKSFPDDFLFGCATASYQVEGAWNVSDKSEDIWNYLTHNHPDLVVDRSNGDVACDSYHKVDEDVAMLKDLGVNFYRFSIAWTRLMPTSFDNKISEDGLRYYNELIDALINAGITPMVTLFHWDLPNDLQKLGGLANDKLVDYFADYARVAFENFGDRVKYWITFNEPQVSCNAYGAGDMAPALVHEDGLADYLCMRTIALSHASIYRLYNETYKPKHNGSCGITLSTVWYQANKTSVADQEAADRMLQFTVGVYAHPILSKEGDFPSVVKERVAYRSEEEGFPYSRLPEFSSEEIEYVKGTYDFLGVNYYTSNLTSDIEEPEYGDPKVSYDEKAHFEPDPQWEETAADWFKVNPEGFTNLLVWIKEQYNNPTVIITENGYPDLGQLDDTKRIEYFKSHLSALLDAIDQGCNIVGYTAWSLMDNFEWLYGYTVRFGLYHVDFENPQRPRTEKASARYYKKVISSRVVEQEDDTEKPEEKPPTTEKPEEKPPATEKPGENGNDSGSTIVISFTLCIVSFMKYVIDFIIYL